MISKILSNIGNSKVGQRFFNWAAQPKSEKFLNQRIPQAETVLTTAMYMISTAKQKNIDDDRKKMLQIQHVASGAVGLTLSTIANKAVSNYSEKVIKHLDPKKIDSNSIKKVSTGLRVFGPIFVTAACMRWLVPVGISLFSSHAKNKININKKEKVENAQTNPIKEIFNNSVKETDKKRINVKV